MKYLLFIWLIMSVTGKSIGQNYIFAELQGSPNLDITGWNLTGNATIGNTNGTTTNFNDELILTGTGNFESGGVFWNQPINLNLCTKWTVEFDFRIFDGTVADGLAFCFLDVPPTGFVNGNGIGIPGGSNGLKVVIDTYDNCGGPNPELQIFSGMGYDECSPGIIKAMNNGGQFNFIRSNAYQSAKITYDNGNVSFYINNTLYLSGFAPANFNGYMGFTASTGGETDRHSIKNVTIYTEQAVANAGQDMALCSGQTVQIGAPTNPNYSYNWSPSTGLSNSTISNPTITLQNNTANAMTYSYTVETTFSNLPGVCPSYDSVNVTVHPYPEITVLTPEDICEGDTIILAAQNVGTANVSWTGGVSNNVPFVPPTGITTYEVTVDMAGCATTDIVTITVDSASSYYIGNIIHPSTCGANDGSIVLVGLTPNTNYTVSYNGIPPIMLTSDTNGHITLLGLIADTYSDFEIYNGGCTSPLNESVQLIEPPGPSINVGPDQIICEGETVVLTVTNPDNASVFWSPTIVDGAPFLPPLGNTTYIVTATLNNCVSQDSIQITVLPTPLVDAGSDQTICEGAAITLSGSGASNYIWNNGIQDGVPFEPPVGTTIYSLTGTTNGCVGTDDVSITVIAFRAPEFEIEDLVQCTNASVNFILLSEGNNVNCLWDLGDGTTIVGCNANTHQYTQTGCFDITLTVSNAIGCSSDTTFEDAICIKSSPIALFSADPPVINTIEPIVSFTNLSVGATSYLWDFGDFSPYSFEVNPSHEYPNNENTSFEATLIAYNENQCSDTARTTIHVQEALIFWVPNAFTPDQDSFNETFLPIFTSGFDPLYFNLSIYNRWGELIFVSNNSEVGWDGTYGGKIVQEGSYIWKISFKNKYSGEKEIHQGHVTLLK